MKEMRNYDQEFADSMKRRYAYDFDYRMHGYMMRVFEGHLVQDRALELGCYKGEFTAALKQWFGKLTVVEASRELIDEAGIRVGGGVSFLHSTFEQADLPEGSFDSVFLIHTLEHLDDPVSVLKKIGRWLSPAGKLFVAVPNANALSRQLAVKMGLVDFNAAITRGESEHGHRNTFALDTLEHTLNKSGLHIVETGGIFLKPFANFQFDLMLRHEVINEAYLDACFELGKKYPDFCASIYAVCTRGS